LAGSFLPDRAELEADLFAQAIVTRPDEHSSHLQAISSHLDSVPLHLEAGNKEWEALNDIAGKVRNSGKIDKDTMKSTILELCSNHFLTSEQVGLLLGRDSNGLRARFLTPMQQQGLLEHRFPALPNHKEQAYRVKS
jgi:hypothetical protein